MIVGPTPRAVTLSIVRSIADRHKVALRDVMGRTRLPEIMAARQEAYVEVAKAFPLFSVTQIARFFHKDHATILHAWRRAGHYHPGPLGCRSVAPCQGNGAPFSHEISDDASCGNTNRDQHPQVLSVSTNRSTEWLTKYEQSVHGAGQ